MKTSITWVPDFDSGRISADNRDQIFAVDTFERRASAEAAVDVQDVVVVDVFERRPVKRRNSTRLAVAAQDGGRRRIDLKRVLNR